MHAPSRVDARLLSICANLCKTVFLFFFYIEVLVIYTGVKWFRYTHTHTHSIVRVCVLSRFSRVRLCDPMDCGLSGDSVHGILPGKNIAVGCHALFPTEGRPASLPSPVLAGGFFTPSASCFLTAQLVKNPPAMQGTSLPFLGQEDPLEKGRATDSSILA